MYKKGIIGIIIAIDGMAASGKGTLSKKLATHFGYDYLDTGLLYRRTAYEAIIANIDLDNLAEVLKVAKNIDYTQSISEDLHTDEIGSVASRIAVYKGLRKELNKIQLDFPNGRKGVVIDGRDIGTVIFPNADLKFFITASLEERAKRRYLQLKNKGKEIIFDVVLRDLKERDERDSKRLVAPTVAASDAVIIDSSELDADDVFNLVVLLSSKAIDSN